MPTDMVTGAFGQTGAAIAKRLLDAGRQVRSLTRAPPDPTGRIKVVPPSFDDPPALTTALQGCDTLYSTYWARFGIDGSFAPLVNHSRTLFSCAKAAGVRRIVLLSVAHADTSAQLPYWQGKAALERALLDSGAEHRIIRPTVIFGEDDTLVNNAAWTMRRLPLLPVPRGAAATGMRPVHVDDVAALAIGASQGDGPTIVDTIAPDRMTYHGFLTAIRDATGARCRFPVAPAGFIAAGARILRPLLRDTLVNRDELDSLLHGLYDVDGDANCPTSFLAWLGDQAETLGRHYRSQTRRAEGREYPGHPG